MRCLPLFALATLLAAGVGCEVNRARSADSGAVQALAPEEPVSVPGPYSISADGSVQYRSIPRPNGHLLGTRNATQLHQSGVMPWIEETARSMGGDQVYVRSIIGPYRIDPEAPAHEMNQMVYDVVIEVWEPRSDEHDHS